MKRILLGSILVLGLSGCTSSLSEEYVLWAQVVCNPHGGLDKISFYKKRLTTICKDGTQITRGS